MPGTERCTQAPGIEIAQQGDLRVAARDAVLEQRQGRGGIRAFTDAPGEFTGAAPIQLH